VPELLHLPCVPARRGKSLVITRCSLNAIPPLSSDSASVWLFSAPHRFSPLQGLLLAPYISLIVRGGYANPNSSLPRHQRFPHASSSAPELSGPFRPGRLFFLLFGTIFPAFFFFDSLQQAPNSLAHFSGPIWSWVT